MARAVLCARRTPRGNGKASPAGWGSFFHIEGNTRRRTATTAVARIGHIDRGRRELLAASNSKIPSWRIDHSRENWIRGRGLLKTGSKVGDPPKEGRRSAEGGSRALTPALSHRKRSEADGRGKMKPDTARRPLTEGPNGHRDQKGGELCHLISARMPGGEPIPAGNEK